MNTLIYLWIEPLIMNHKRSDARLYFNLIVDDDWTRLSIQELENNISGSIMQEIMDYANIESNFNYEVVHAIATSLTEPNIEFADSPDVVAEKLELSIKEDKLTELINSDSTFELSLENINVSDAGDIEISVPQYAVKQSINSLDLWNVFEKNILGKLKEGQSIELIDDNGNKIFDICGGSYLNVGLAEYKIYDKNKKSKYNSIFTENDGFKGGFFIREDGTIAYGDFERTFYASINLNHLLKASIKANTNLIDFVKTKELEDLKNKK